MKKIVKIILFGVLTWLAPFIVSIFFYSGAGVLKTDIFLFKTVMILTGIIVAELSLIFYYSSINEKYLWEGIILGLIWLVINWFLDFIILLPMSGMNVKNYFIQIGFTYLAIPAITISTGYIFDKKK